MTPPARNHLDGTLRILRRAGARQKDAEIVRAVLQGEPGAFRMLWDRHCRKVYRVLERALGAGEDVDDLIQEVFIRVFSRAAKIREPAALGEFVVSVATRVLKWELRRRWARRWLMLSTTGDLPETVDSASNPEARQALRRCYRILDSLSARARDAFVLRYMEEQTMSEVAGRLGVSISTAKRLVNRAADTVEALVGEDRDLRLFFMGERGEQGDLPQGSGARHRRSSPAVIEVNGNPARLDLPPKPDSARGAQGQARSRKPLLATSSRSGMPARADTDQTRREGS
ncbi:MAG TPA: sigma-70 family RNA polymerase sigma factor [Polyangia bacterium]|nr:sigma-70 family RNA polymerase sigma factor [Polyangia bacterium]